MSVYAQDFGYFFNSNSGDRTYNAESFEEWLKPFFLSGVFNGNLEVTAQTTPDMTVNVSAGYANLNGKLARWTGTNVMTLSAASGVYDRIDTIVLRRDNTNRTISIEVVTGVAALNPSPTAPTRDADVFELVLAQIFVGIGVTAINPANITDTRMDSDICGWVAATVDQIDFDQILTQFNGWIADTESDFMDWFDAMKDQLSEDAAGHLQLEIDDINAKIGNTPLPTTAQTLTGATAELAGVTDDLANEISIVVNGDQSAVSATAGQYIILRNSTIVDSGDDMLPDGLYTAAQAIPANTSIDKTYLTAVSGGGLNALNSNIGALPHFIGTTVTVKDTLTSGTQKTYNVTEDGWYFVRAVNSNTSGSCYAGVWSDWSRTIMLAYNNAGTGTYIRATSPVLPLKKGSAIVVQAGFTDSGDICKLS